MVFRLRVQLQCTLITKMSSTSYAVVLTKARKVLINFKGNIFVGFRRLLQVILNLVDISWSSFSIHRFFVLFVLGGPSPTVCNSSHDTGKISKLLVLVINQVNLRTWQQFHNKLASQQFATVSLNSLFRYDFW
jgi:hypothetical protein